MSSYGKGFSLDSNIKQHPPTRRTLKQHGHFRKCRPQISEEKNGFLFRFWHLCPTWRPSGIIMSFPFLMRTIKLIDVILLKF